MASHIRFQNPETLSKPPGYTQVVEAMAPARIIYIAGQLGLDKDGQLVGAPGDFHAQAVQTYENLGAALQAAGATFADVVKMNNYLLNISDIATFRDVRDRYVNTNAPPASTTLAVSEFARAGALLEIEAIAVLPASTAGASSRRVKTTRLKAKASPKSAPRGGVKKAKTKSKSSATRNRTAGRSNVSRRPRR